VTASVVGVTKLSAPRSVPPPAPVVLPSVVKVSVASSSVFFGNTFVLGMYTALRVRSTRNVAGRRRADRPVASRNRKSVRSTSTRPRLSAATVKPQRIDVANDSRTARCSSALPFGARKR
jgi:hypothetical protein